MLFRSQASHCATVGAALARMHLAGQDYHRAQPNLRGLSWWVDTAPLVRPHLSETQLALLNHELAYQLHISESAAYRALPQFRGESAFYTWLYRITFNMAIDLRRRGSRRGGNHVEFKETWGVKDHGSGNGGDASGPTVSSSLNHLQNVEGPFDALSRRELGSKLQAVMQELSDEHREVITLREVDGLDYQEIADAIGVPRGTVMSRLFYARKALQKALKEYDPLGGSARERDEESVEDAPVSSPTGLAKAR